MGNADDLVRAGFQALVPHLRHFAARHFESKYGPSFRQKLSRPGKRPFNDNDPRALIKAVLSEWEITFRGHAPGQVKQYLHQLQDVGNRHAHHEEITIDETYHALLTMRLLAGSVTDWDAILEFDRLIARLPVGSAIDRFTHGQEPAGETTQLPTLPYDMGNAGDMLKHGLLSEFAQWWCEQYQRPLRFFDPFAGRWSTRPHPAVARRLQALSRCALIDAQPTPLTRYHGSSQVVMNAASAAGGAAQVFIGDADADALAQFPASFQRIAASQFDPSDGYSLLQAQILADLILVDPFADFLPKHAEAVVPKLSNLSSACVLFVLNLDPQNHIGRRYAILRDRYLADAWCLHCPKLRDSGVRGESKYEVDVILQWHALNGHPHRDALRERLSRFAGNLSEVLKAPVTFTTSRNVVVDYQNEPSMAGDGGVPELASCPSVDSHPFDVTAEAASKGDGVRATSTASTRRLAVGTGGQRVVDALLMLSTNQPPNPAEEVRWHARRCAETARTTFMPTTKALRNLVPGESRIGFYGNKELQNRLLATAIFRGYRPLSGLSGNALLRVCGELYVGGSHPEGLKGIIELADVTLAANDAAVDQFGGTICASGLPLTEANLPQSAARTLVYVWREPSD